jgi:hypothetical protein
VNVSFTIGERELSLPIAKVAFEIPDVLVAGEKRCGSPSVTLAVLPLANVLVPISIDQGPLPVKFIFPPLPKILIAVSKAGYSLPVTLAIPVLSYVFFAIRKNVGPKTIGPTCFLILRARGKIALGEATERKKNKNGLRKNRFIFIPL